MKKQLSTVFAVAALAVLGACSSSPTGTSTAAPSRVQADEMVVPTDLPQTQPQDTTTTQRVPNMMGSGN